MAPTRRALQPISANIQRKKELKEQERGQIEGLFAVGVKKVDIARRMQRTPETVATTLKRASIRTNQKSLPRSGRPYISTSRDE